ncbi:hypothetical protein [Aeromonas veronii]|uniref:hypothetical protein n=1 Tax=Aeromonas veronii TaxID=654 RepID=UPI0015D6550B|nr:hypothetical protein [Aeromonas veronii]
MKALMIDTLMSAGSILDIGSDTKQNLSQLRHRLQIKPKQNRFKVTYYNWSIDSQNLSNDWHTVGHDMQKSLDIFAAENDTKIPNEPKWSACVEQTR